MAEKKEQLKGRTFGGPIRASGNPELEPLDCWVRAELDAGHIALSQDSKLTWASIGTARRYANYILALCDQQESKEVTR